MPPDPKSHKFYRDQLRKLGNPPLGEWGRLAISHWRQNLPDFVRELGPSLRPAAILAQENAKAMFGRQVEGGMDPRAAQEIALAEYVLLLPKDPPDPADRIEGQNNQRAALSNFLADPSRPTPRRMPATSSSATPPPSPPAV